MNRPVSLLLCALGGEGGGVLSEWLVDIAREAGYPAQSTSIPGVAQRTGATTYYIEVFPTPVAQLGGRQPVFSLNPVPGALDALVSSELLETTRQIGSGMASPERTMVITSSARTLTTQERMQLGDGRADSAPWLQVVREFSRARHVFDMGSVARESGTVVSAVMLGAIAGSGLFPFTREQYEHAVRASGGGAAASLRGFAQAFEIVAKERSASRATTQSCDPALEPGSRTLARHDGLRVKPAMTTSVAAMTTSAAAMTEAATAMTSSEHDRTSTSVAALPEAVRDIAALGAARTKEYQNAAYADLYLQRLHALLAAEREADPRGEHQFATTRETARWLALWMAFEDIVRVADLKSRGSRWERVKGEVKASDADLLRVYDHFKPGAPEFAALLPTALAQRLLRWDRGRVARGKSPWALPLKIGTHSITGMLALRTLASLKWLRVRGSRYRVEQQMIGRWLDGIAAGTRRDWRLGQEIALCGRLIKGYGATNERGKENLLHVLDHLAHGADAPAAAQAVAAARTAALADDAGQALDAALVQHGAPPRPVKAVPIRFVRRAGAPGKA
jgi:indolepyruvate ferredoxin oxidoreductase, beta subunit